MKAWTTCIVSGRSNNLVSTNTIEFQRNGTASYCMLRLRAINPELSRAICHVRSSSRHMTWRLIWRRTAARKIVVSPAGKPIRRLTSRHVEAGEHLQQLRDFHHVLERTPDVVGIGPRQARHERGTLGVD